jgi:DNA-3-methyladenine glycosylase
MKKNRGKTEEKNLVNGPAKLTQALNITKKQYGTDLTKDSNLFISEGLELQGKIIATPRIGIKTALDNLWNFKIQIN